MIYKLILLKKKIIRPRIEFRKTRMNILGKFKVQYQNMKTILLKI